MRWDKFISSILHPVVMPTVGVLLYYFLVPYNFETSKLYTLLGIIFITTYILPILLLIVLKSLGQINSFEVFSIKERKIPLFFMVSLFLLLGNFFYKIGYFRDLSYLFLGIVMALIIVFIIFLLNFKTSLHLLSIGSAVGFFLMFQIQYQINIWPVIYILIVLSGVLGASRLSLKAHTLNEVCAGFILGIISQIAINYIL
ncbi:phosphatase PAP2 family protein [Tenacibaculum geojense]|uniref:Phosphatase PAP2 family protein n=1 Tax=Tenacibaculum geojense TaxID=915352 RepID=A0ABW3JR04_9FLAO